MMPAEMLCVAAGGALGALCRHGVSLWCADRFGKAFPCGTLLVNVSGSLLMGLLAGCWQRWGTPSAFALFAGAGFLGALTTFSIANDVAKYFAINGYPRRFPCRASRQGNAQHRAEYNVMPHRHGCGLFSHCPVTGITP